MVCIEIDSRLLPVLDETLAGYDNIKIVNQDVLKVDLHRLIQEEFGDKPVAVCANLPYYITSPIIMSILEARLPIQALTVMVQKEAAQRICALPGSREVGAVSLAIRYYCEPKVLFQVSRGSFLPAPDVDSTVIRLDIRPEPPVQLEREEFFFQVVKGAFSQRRKTLSNTLSGSLGMSKPQVAQLLEEAGVSHSLRAEQLSMEQFAQIANALAAATR